VKGFGEELEAGGAPLCDVRGPSGAASRACAGGLFGKRVEGTRWLALGFMILLAVGLGLTVVPAIGPGYGLAASQERQTDQLEARISRIENGLVPSKGAEAGPQPLAGRMAALNVPGVSIAVFDDYRIVWARGYGVADAETGTKTTIETLFQAASISKPVAAAAALRLVERRQLRLDEDVNGKLKSWKVRENGFTGPNKVTLRHLLTHSGGLTVHGFRGYAAGERVPTLLQVLNGEQPANSVGIEVDLPLGSRWRYSGGGFCVMQQLLVDELGKPFPEIMQELVLRPAGMTSSTYEQPLPDALRSRAATGHRRNGRPVNGRWHTYPEMAAAGLWATPEDLARFCDRDSACHGGKEEQPSIDRDGARDDNPAVRTLGSWIRGGRLRQRRPVLAQRRQRGFPVPACRVRRGGTRRCGDDER
jgi:CubicO group peptidase (beta-lactamase class C family)